MGAACAKPSATDEYPANGRDHLELASEAPSSQRNDMAHGAAGDAQGGSHLPRRGGDAWGAACIKGPVPMLPELRSGLQDTADSSQPSSHAGEATTYPQSRPGSGTSSGAASSVDLALQQHGTVRDPQLAPVMSTVLEQPLSQPGAVAHVSVEGSAPLAAGADAWHMKRKPLLPVMSVLGDSTTLPLHGAQQGASAVLRDSAQQAPTQATPVAAAPAGAMAKHAPAGRARMTQADAPPADAGAPTEAVTSSAPQGPHDEAPAPAAGASAPARSSAQPAASTAPAAQPLPAKATAPPAVAQRTPHMPPERLSPAGKGAGNESTLSDLTSQGGNDSYFMNPHAPQHAASSQPAEPLAIEPGSPLESTTTLERRGADAVFSVPSLGNQSESGVVPVREDMAPQLAYAPPAPPPEQDSPAAAVHDEPGGSAFSASKMLTHGSDGSGAGSGLLSCRDPALLSSPFADDSAQLPADMAAMAPHDDDDSASTLHITQHSPLAADGSASPASPAAWSRSLPFLHDTAEVRTAAAAAELFGRVSCAALCGLCLTSSMSRNLRACLKVACVHCTACDWTPFLAVCRWALIGRHTQ